MRGSAYPCQHRFGPRDKPCGLAPNNTIHQKNRQQFGYHEYKPSPKPEIEPSVYARRLQALRNAAERIEDLGGAKDILVELIEVLIEEDI
jgi:hypothetical protein